MTEADIGVVSLEGVENWRRLEGFSWLAEDLLGGAVRGLVVLDRDVRPASALKRVKQALSKAGLRSHVWRLHEFENYLVHPAALARVSNAGEDVIAQFIEEVCEGLKQQVYGLALKYWWAEGKGTDPKEIGEAVAEYIEAEWATSAGRLALCPGKELLSGINRRLQAAGFETFSNTRLIDAMRPDEIDHEIVTVLDLIEDL
jgi:hypothetical protein